MIRTLKIAIADDEADVLDFYELALTELGHQVVITAKDGQELVDRCRESSPDLLIVDVNMPRMDGINAIREITADRSIPAITVTAYHEPLTLARSLSENILTYLVKPIKQADLGIATAMAIRWYDEIEGLRIKAMRADRSVDSRRTIVCATRGLMQHREMSVKQAHQHLRDLAAREHRSLVEVARKVINALATPRRRLPTRPTT